MIFTGVRAGDYVIATPGMDARQLRAQPP